MPQHRDRLSDEERKARRRESARKYREANREKVLEACREAMANKRKDPAFREKEKAYKQTECYKEQQRQYRAENRERLQAKALEWRAANLERFREYQRAYQASNRHRVIEKSRTWRLENADRAKEYARRWRAQNLDRHALKEQRRRARIRGNGGDLSPDIYKRLLVLQKGKCAVCKSDLSKVRPHLDHIMPISLGGLNTDNNVQLLCPPCNLRKHAKHPIDFMQERGFLC